MTILRLAEHSGQSSSLQRTMPSNIYDRLAVHKSAVHEARGTGNRKRNSTLHDKQTAWR